MVKHKFTTPPTMGGYTRGCRCGDCRAIAQAYRRDWSLKHPDRVKAYVRRYAKSEKGQRNQQRYKERYPERIRETQRRYRARHPDKGRLDWERRSPESKLRKRQTNKEWWDGHPRKIREYRAKHQKQANRRYRQKPESRIVRQAGWNAYWARSKNAQGKCTAAQFKARWDFYGGLCYLCLTIAATMDHVIPISRNGTQWPANLRPACSSCNSRKHNKTLSEYLIWLNQKPNKADG